MSPRRSTRRRHPVPRPRRSGERSLRGLFECRGVMLDRLEPRRMLAADPWPAVSAIELVESPGVDASSVAWRVTFTESVTGVDRTDFALALDGVKAQAPLMVTGSGADYTVTAPRVAGSGTIGLNLVDDGSIRDVSDNPLRREGPEATFTPQASYATGTYPESLAVGDFNGDGVPDVVASNIYGSNSGSTLSVFLGRGDGTFQSQRTLAVGVLTASVVVGDVNGDGKADIVVANHVDDNVGVLLGNGDGTFAAQQTFAIGSRPSAVEVGDFNGDGKLDIAATNEAADSVSVLLGNGDGTFATQQAFATGWSPRALTVGDLDSDGVLDLVIANANDDTLGVLLGKGDGTFAAQRAFSTGDTPSDVVIGDLDGDDIPDLVSADWFGNSVGVLLGNGDGTFSPHLSYAAPSPRGVALGDFNQDGRPDIVSANSFSDTVSVLAGGGDGTFGSPQLFAVGDTPTAVVVDDVNGDLKPDVICVNAYGKSVSVLLNSQNGGFTGEVATLRQVFPVVDSIASVASAPTASPIMRWRVRFSEPVTGVDGSDFALALSGVTASARLSVAGRGSTYTVTAFDVSGVGTIGLNLVDNGTIRDIAGNPLVRRTAAAFTPLEPVRAGVDPRSIAVGDVNRDGKLDLAVANAAINYSFKQVTLLLGNGDGTFQALRGFDVASRPLAVAIADMNSDGNPDIVSAGSDGDSVSVLVGKGDGTFSLQQAADVGAAATAIAVADVDGDGMLDVATANPSAGTVSLLLGRGDGTFQPRRTLTAGSSPDSIAAADLDGDGKPDLVAVNSGSNTLGIFLGNGDGTFEPQQTVAAGNVPTAVAIGDLDGDGQADLVTANLTSDVVSIFRGNGDGTFQTRQTVAVGSLPEAVALGDINGDGRLDLFAGNFWGNSVSVLVGKGDGTFEPQQTFATGQEPYGVVVGDMNGDGRADLVTIDYGGYTASVLLNAGVGNFTGAVVDHLGTALTPMLSQPVRSTTDFSVQIRNYDPAFSWSLTKLSAGGTATLSDTGLITVTGLTPGAATTLVVQTSRLDYEAGATTTTIRTLQSALVPSMSVPVPLANGLSVQITNYDPRFTWAFEATAGGSVRVSRTGLVTVVGAAPGVLCTLSITSSRPGYASGSSSVAATTLSPPLVPAFGTVTRTRFGATFQIVNYDPLYAWSGRAGSRASVSISRTGLVTVFGIPSREAVPTVITSARAGHASGMAGVRVPAFSATRG